MGAARSSVSVRNWEAQARYFNNRPHPNFADILMRSFAQKMHEKEAAK